MVSHVDDVHLATSGLCSLVDCFNGLFSLMGLTLVSLAMLQAYICKEAFLLPQGRGSAIMQQVIIVLAGHHRLVGSSALFT